MTTAIGAPGKKKRRMPEKVKIKGFNSSRDLPRILMILPALCLIIVFNYLPIYGIIIAFKDFSPYKGILGSSWVGLKYFNNFLGDSNFWRVMKNTIVINLYTLLVAMPFPVLFALLLNEVGSSLFKRTVQTISYLPHFISWVVAASVVNSLLSPTTGIINQILTNFFGLDEPIYFLAKAKYFRTILVMSSTWKDFGMNAVYYLAALAAIDPQLYEAAKIDGANRFKQTLYITIPGIIPIFTLLFILRVGSMITIGFEQVFLLYNSMVYEVGDVISTYVYRIGIEQAQYSLTTAIGVTQSLVNFILVFTANYTAKKLVGYALW